MILKNFFYICITAIVLSSCNSNLDYEGKAIFRYNEPSGISTLDPAFSKEQSIIWAINQIFNGLVQMDNELNVEPSIAKSWQISEDGLIYTFNLKQDVFFHTNDIFENGTRAVVAKDFKFSFSLLTLQ